MEEELFGDHNISRYAVAIYVACRNNYRTAFQNDHTVPELRYAGVWEHQHMGVRKHSYEVVLERAYMPLTKRIPFY